MGDPLDVGYSYGDTSYNWLYSERDQYKKKYDEAISLMCDLIEMLHDKMIELPKECVQFFSKHNEWDRLSKKGINRPSNWSITEVEINKDE